MSGLPISRLICSHDFFWSRRRQADVCRRCGALSPVLSLHFRGKSAWTVGADLPPERRNGFAPAVDVEVAPDAAEASLRLSAPETAATASCEPQVPARTAGAFSVPIPAPAPGDFSSRSAAPLQRPLVT